MQKMKFLTYFLLIMAVIAVPMGSVFAAPAHQEGLIDGTVTGLICETDTSTAVTIFIVTL